MPNSNTNLRLLGSPVNLTSRSKKKDDRKNVRNRPRSALQNSSFNQDIQERSKRPFSADTKERRPATRSLYKAFSSELDLSSNNCLKSRELFPAFPPGRVITASTNHTDYPTTTIKIVPPTADLLNNTSSNRPDARGDKDICSNASDIGSEDTFISLGTKIKHRAQVAPKPRPRSPSGKNFRYSRNQIKRGRKQMANNNSQEDKINEDYGMDVNITEKEDKYQREAETNRNREFRASSPCQSSVAKKLSYDAYFVSLDGGESRDQDLSGRVSFASSSVQSELEQAIDTYSRRLTLTKQQLSLVEEESIQDTVESPSQRLSSLSPENVIDESKQAEIAEVLTGRNTYVVDEKDDEFPKTPNFSCGPKPYTSFYEDFRSNSAFKPKNDASVTDSSSKDSGYHGSGHNSDAYRHNFSLPSASLQKSMSQPSVEDQPKSLESTSSSGKEYKTFPLDKKNQWNPLNHSRLLYKDFFLKKEGHIALAPQNSPIKVNNNIPLCSENAIESSKSDVQNENSEYPSYLLNSTTKAYTSKVIEDYKKELEAINSLHELTIKDIKTDAISPTPLNIDKMFEQNSSSIEEKQDLNDKLHSTNSIFKNKNSLDGNKEDISKVSTKELIQKYLDVRGGGVKGPKPLKRFDSKKPNYAVARVETGTNKYEWNNKKTDSKISNYKNTTQINKFTTNVPLSARIESVQNDKDVDSWMSLVTSSPRAYEIESHRSVEINAEGSKTVNIEPSPTSSNGARNLSNENRAKIEDATAKRTESDSANTSMQHSSRSKELKPNSTVLDIYSMLKEIESYGDNPVTSVASVDIPETPKPETTEEQIQPKDNYMEIFEFLEKVEQSANDALNVVTTTTPQTIPKLDTLLRLPHTELAQRLVTASLQLEERSCCIALLQESLSNHKEQMIKKVSDLEKQSTRNISKVKQECEETIKRHQTFIDQLINDKKTLNHRIEQLVDERRSLEERWKRSAHALEERYKLELRNQHDKMAAAQQVARQRWVRQKAEKIKELTVKGLEGELREMAERQQKEVSDLKMQHAEYVGRMQSKHAAELEELRRALEGEREAALVKERQIASSRLEKQILDLEVTYQEQRTRLVAEMRAENERAARALADHEAKQRDEIEKWRKEQEKLILDKRLELENDMAKEKEKIEETLQEKQKELEEMFEQYKKDFEAEQQLILKKKVTELAAQHKQERDREIEKAIESMDAEAQRGRKELQEALRRTKEQYEEELKSLAETEQATLKRYQDAQARIRHTEDRCAELEVTISQLETRNKVLTEKNIQLDKEVLDVRAQTEAAWRARTDALQKEIEDLKNTHEEQMHQLYAKVKVAVARKDSAIQALTRETSKSQEKIALLESKLQQQRKDFLKQVK